METYIKEVERMNYKKFLSIILVFSLFIQLALAFLYADPPNVPHNFFSYLAAIDMIKKGTLYLDLMPNYPMTFPYGPLTALTLASWNFLFGVNFVLLKIPFIVYNLATIIVVYSLIKTLINAEAAKYGIILYAFSFATIWSAGAEGDNNILFLFFEMLSLLLLFRNHLALSSISLGLALGFKIIPVFALLPMLYYIYRNDSWKMVFKYLFATLATFSLILLPFYLKAGSNVLFPYLPTKYLTIDGLNILNLAKMITYYFIFGYDKPYDTYLFPLWFSTPSTIFGVVLVVLYILKFKLKNIKLELIRNIFLLNLTIMVFSSQFYWNYVLWIFPFILIMAVYYRPDMQEFSLNYWELSGIIFVFAGAIIISNYYRELAIYDSTGRMILSSAILLIFFGTFFTLVRTKIRVAWSIVILASAASYTTTAKVLLLFGSIIPSLRVPRIAWGYEYFITIVLMLVGLFILVKTMHELTAEDIQLRPQK